MIRNYITVFLLGLMGTASSLLGQDIPQDVPSVQVKTIDDVPVNFNTFITKNSITLVSFWATWCGPCIKELQAIDERYAEWQEKYSVKLIAVSIDDARNSRKVKPKVLAENWKYEIVLDENMDLARTMNVNNPPMMFIYDKNGKLVYTHQGYTPGGEDELEKKLQELTK